MLEALSQERLPEAANPSPEKLCSKCGLPGEFRAGHAQCKACEKQYGRDRYRENNGYFATYRETNRTRYRKQNVENLQRKKAERHIEIDRLKSVPCVECGGSFPPYVMDFDHREPSAKEHEINSLLNKTACPWQRILDEVAKCDVVCVRCHRMRTWETPKSPLDNRRKLIISLKSVPCADCGGSFHYCQMDFDHVRGEKVECVPLLKNKASILVEAAKCDVVCANCHRVRSQRLPTAARRVPPTPTILPRAKSAHPAPRPWHAYAGSMTDEALAARFHVSKASICMYRKRVGIPSFKETHQMKMESVHG